MADLSTITLPSGDTYNLKDSNAVPSSEKATANGVATLDANGLIPQSQVPGMVILSYGNNTWADFLEAYQKNNIIYCRASSNSNPASGSQTRLAFMAYVNNATSPTNVEFQYYRSVSSHNATQQGDQVYVYKLDKSSGWSVTVREAYTRVVTNNGLASTWSSGVLTAHADIVSTTKLNNAATAATEVSGRVYPVALDTNGKLAVNVPWESGGAGAVRYDEAQSLTSAQKSQARSNIEASGMIESTITAKNSLTIPSCTSGDTLQTLDLVLGSCQNFNGYGEMWSWGESKNLLTTIQDGANGNVTWTANPNGSVSMHGIAYSSSPFGFRNVTLSPGTYIFSGFSPEYLDRGRFVLVNPSNQVMGEDRGGGFQFTISAQMSLGVNFQPYAGVNMEGVTLYPMICLASDPNPLVYEPYCNISLFDGRSTANIDLYGNAPTDYHSYAVSLGQMVYGATLDVTSGDMTVTHGYVNINDFSQNPVQQTQGGQYVWEAYLGDMDDDTAVCSMLHQSSIADAMLATDPCFFVDSGAICVCAKDSTWAKFSARYKFLEFVYPLSSPTTAQVTQTQVTLFDGTNYLSVQDCDITVATKTDVADYVKAMTVRKVGSAVFSVGGNFGSTTLPVSSNPTYIPLQLTDGDTLPEFDFFTIWGMGTGIYSNNIHYIGYSASSDLSEVNMIFHHAQSSAQTVFGCNIGFDLFKL